MREQPRGFAKGIFWFALFVLCLLVFLWLNSCSMAYGQEGKVKERVEFIVLSEWRIFKLPIDSIRTSDGEKKVNNVSYEQSINMTGADSNWQKMFKESRQLYYYEVIWRIKHFRTDDDGNLIIRKAVVKYIFRSGRFMALESYVTRYPPKKVIANKKKFKRISRKKIERLKNE